MTSSRYGQVSTHEGPGPGAGALRVTHVKQLEVGVVSTTAIAKSNPNTNNCNSSSNAAGGGANHTAHGIGVVVHEREIMVIEDERKLRAAIDNGNQKVIITAMVALSLIRRQTQLKYLSAGCFVIALVLAVVFGVLFGQWQSKATHLQAHVSKLRRSLSSNVFYTNYSALADLCSADDYFSNTGVCYEVGVTVNIANPYYGQDSNVVLSLAKDPSHDTECLTQSEYQCTVRHFTYAATEPNNCFATDYLIDDGCASYLTDRYDACTQWEQDQVSAGGSFYSSSENCHVGTIAERLQNGYVAACSDCKVVLPMEKVVEEAKKL